MTTLLSFHKLSVAHKTAILLSDIDFAATPGEMIGHVGANGAGKSTLLRAAAGLAPIAGGRCEIEGRDMRALSPIARARRIAYLPQARPIFWSISVRSVVTLGRFAYGAGEKLDPAGAEAVERAMEEAGVLHLQDRPVMELSGGETARVHLARLLAAETPVILADEPTAALDPRHQLAAMEVLRRRADEGALVLVALHDIDLAARFCTRIIFLHEGAIIADGAPREALSAEALARGFGVVATRLGDAAAPVFRFELPA